MSDEQHEPTLSPAEDARIRALLAEARHAEPVPGDVAARLDRVLAGLQQDREERLAPVVELASRRRRTAASLLVAAAAVIVAGVGVSQVLPRGGGGNDTAAGGAGDTAAESQQDSSGGLAAAPSAPADRNTSPSSTPGPEGAPALLAPVHIRSAHFGADVRRARTEAKTQYAASDAPFAEFEAAGCPPMDVGDGEVVAATYDDAGAVLVLRPAAGDTQVVDLYLCDDVEPRRSITLTAP